MRLPFLCVVLAFGLPLAQASGDLPKPGKADAAWFEANPYAADSSVHAYVIAQDIAINFGFLNFGTAKLSRRIDFRRIVRVLDPQGYGQALVKIRYYDPESGGTAEQLSNLEAYTHQMLDGRLQTQKVAKEERYRTRISPEMVEVAFSFPGVVAGTVLDLNYSRESGNMVGCPITYFQDDIPVQVAETRLCAHDAFQYQTHVLGHERVDQSIDRKPYPYANVGGNLIVTTFRAENLPAISSEPFITTLGNYAAHLRVELERFVPPEGMTVEISGDWAKISKDLTEFDGIKAAMRGKGHYRDWAAACPADLTDPVDKAAWAMQMVASNVRWNGYHAAYASKRIGALTTKGEGYSADVNAALLGLLRALDLEAYPVFISTREHGRLLQHIRNSASINSMIVALTAGDKTFLLDATDPAGYPGVLPEDDLNGSGLLVNDEGAYSFVELQDGTIDQRAIQAQLEVDAGGYLVGTAALTLSGLAAKPYVTASTNGLVLSLDTSALLEGFAVSKLMIAREKGYSWRITADIRSEQPALDLGDALAFNPVIAPQWTKNPFVHAERRYPVEFPAKIIETRQINLKLPEGKRLETLPALVNLTTINRDAIYRYQVLDNDNTLSISTMLVIKNLTYLPERYPEVRGLFGMVVEQEGTLLSIVDAE